MAGETTRWDALRRRPLAPFGTRRLPALHWRRSNDVRAALSVREPATPVSQLLAPGPVARERSPAIARVPMATLAGARGAASIDGGVSPLGRPGEAWPYLRPVSHRCSVFTASHDDAPS
jgi:hypothetical protein